MAILPNPRQIRGARAMLGWSMVDLARAAGLSVSTVKRAEESAHEPVSGAAVTLLASTLEAAGMTFLHDDGSGAGVRCRAPGDGLKHAG